VPTAWQAGDTTPFIESIGGPFRSLLPEDSGSLIVPVHHHDRLAGVLVVQPGRAGMVDDGLVRVCSSIALHLAMALTNARLFQDLQHKHAELLHSEQARDQLTQMVVHDLKNPLSAIQANLAMLDATARTDEQHELIEEVSTSTTHMLRLITDLLDIARLEEGRLELRRWPTNANDLLFACASELRPWAVQAEKHVEVVRDISLPLLHVDARLMQRVITNLLSNAIKHTPSGTHIKLGAEVDPSGVRLWVQDNGEGIAPEQQARLFERFKTGGSSGALQSNTGLGLTFCKLAVEAHGGTISIFSAQGAGTTFLIELPLETVDEMVEL
jgi:signal transduction histidine kinase